MSTKQPISTCLGIAAAVVLASSNHAGDIFVNGTCGNDGWSGLSDVCLVPDGPKATIQAGMNAAVNGDVVIVAQGEYFETIDFFGKAITVRSTDPNDAGVVLNTIIHGDGGSVVRCTCDELANTVLSGFVITGGGRGMFNFFSFPTVTNCTFSGNGSTVGGGMYNFNSSPTVTNCSFSGNVAFSQGGGMFNDSSHPTVTNCTFSENSATSGGGGMFNAFGSSPTVTNCSFVGNVSTSGGGMRNSSGFPTLTNCTFSGNGATSGGGMYSTGGSPTLTNTGFCDNTPEAVVGGFIDGGGNSLLYCPPPIAKPDPCPTDINGDGVTNVLDLIDVLLAFGAACP